MNKGWLELESDPGLFTLLLEDFGVNGVQVEEIYDLQKPIEGTVYGFIFLFRWIEERRSRRKINSEVESFVTDADSVNKIFFAQQIIPNSCATHALLSVLLNCGSKVKLGKTLNIIKDFTDCMSPEDKGYAIANMPELARVHNSYARPETKKPVQEKQAAGLSSVRATDSETFHFVSYVPIHGHLFELDGLKPHPIDHGPWENGNDWTEKFRQVITNRLGMATGGEPYHDIRFNLMAVVPDKRQLLEQKLVTLKTNRNIVLETLQQVVSPTSSERSDSDGPSSVRETKKCVTFSTDIPGGNSLAVPTGETCNVVTSSVAVTAPSSTQPPSILKHMPSSIPTSTSHDNTPALHCENSTTTSSSQPATQQTLLSNDQSSTSASSSDSKSSDTRTDSHEEQYLKTSESNLVDLVTTKEATDQTLGKDQSACADCTKPEVVENGGSKPDSTTNSIDPPDVKSEQMEIKEETDDSLSSKSPQISVSSPPAIKIETEGTVTVETSVSDTLNLLKPDITKPLSIETKFSSSPCAASNESTDTASEFGSGFSSPGSLNTSSSQSSPHSDGQTGGAEGSDEKHLHRRKRRAGHAFTPKDLLYLLKNVEHEIEVCEMNLKEENEKRKKYKIDACRRTHNYDQFIVTFLSMLAEQGLLGDLMEENMPVKRPSSGSGMGYHSSVSAAKVTKKSSSASAQSNSSVSVSSKKKSSKIKKKGKK